MMGLFRRSIPKGAACFASLYLIEQRRTTRGLARSCELILPSLGTQSLGEGGSVGYHHSFGTHTMLVRGLLLMSQLMALELCRRMPFMESALPTLPSREAVAVVETRHTHSSPADDPSRLRDLWIGWMSPCITMSCVWLLHLQFRHSVARLKDHCPKHRSTILRTGLGHPRCLSALWAFSCIFIYTCHSEDFRLSMFRPPRFTHNSNWCCFLLGAGTKRRSMSLTYCSNSLELRLVDTSSMANDYATLHDSHSELSSATSVPSRDEFSVDLSNINRTASDGQPLISLGHANSDVPSPGWESPLQDSEALEEVRCSNHANEPCAQLGFPTVVHNGRWNQQILVDRSLRSMAVLNSVFALIMLIVCVVGLKPFIDRRNPYSTSIWWGSDESCSSVENKNLGIHLIINISATMLLGVSNTD